jgi:Flp pilus assembly pilin Flp
VTCIRRLIRDEAAQDMAEYAMLLAFIAVLCILAMQHLGNALNGTYGAASSSLMSSVS